MTLDPIQREIQVMMDQDSWPYSVLPLVRANRHNVGKETAFLVRGKGPVVYQGNVWDPRNSDRHLAEIPCRRYGDFTSIVRDGWRAD